MVPFSPREDDSNQQPAEFGCGTTETQPGLFLPALRSFTNWIQSVLSHLPLKPCPDTHTHTHMQTNKQVQTHVAHTRHANTHTDLQCVCLWLMRLGGILWGREQPKRPSFTPSQ